MTEPTKIVPPQPPTTAVPDDRPHKPADDREEIYYEGTPMLRGDLTMLLGFGAIGILLIAAPVIWDFSAHKGWPIWWVTLALEILGIILLCVPFILIRSTRYRISNYRIDYERGLLGRRIDTLELWHVEDISFTQSFLDRIMGVGNIKVMSHDETTPELLLKNLPNPRAIFEQLKQRVIAVKRQRGVIKMDVGS